jgi:Zn-dependent protease with chaperone function
MIERDSIMCRLPKVPPARLTRTLIVALLSAGISHPQSYQPLDEITLGLRYRSSILSRLTTVRGTPEESLAQQVFLNLVRSTAVASGPALPYELTILESGVVNAFTTPGGKVYATTAIAGLLKQDRGLWAAVLGHELGHGVGQHIYKAYLREFRRQVQIAYYRAKAAEGDDGAYWALLGAELAGGLVNLKLSRDEEHEADRLGVAMMAEAGYHPDFALALFRTLRVQTGEQSKIAAFFSDHPRWESREERTLKAYSDAVFSFQARWPIVARSPGGTPPPFATCGPITTVQDKVNRQAIISAPVRARNAQNLNLVLVVSFYENGRPVPAAVPEYRTAQGSLAAAHPWQPASNNVSSEIPIRVPTEAVGRAKRKVKAFSALLIGDEVLCRSDMFDVVFPK